MVEAIDRWHERPARVGVDGKSVGNERFTFLIIFADDHLREKTNNAAECDIMRCTAQLVQVPSSLGTFQCPRRVSVW